MSRSGRIIASIKRNCGNTGSAATALVIAARVASMMPMVSISPALAEPVAKVTEDLAHRFVAQQDACEA